MSRLFAGNGMFGSTGPALERVLMASRIASQVPTTIGVQEPVLFSDTDITTNPNVQLINNELQLVAGRYEIDICFNANKLNAGVSTFLIRGQVAVDGVTFDYEEGWFFPFTFLNDLIVRPPYTPKPYFESKPTVLPYVKVRFFMELQSTSTPPPFTSGLHMSVGNTIPESFTPAIGLTVIRIR